MKKKSGYTTASTVYILTEITRKEEIYIVDKYTIAHSTFVSEHPEYDPSTLIFMSWVKCLFHFIGIILLYVETQSCCLYYYSEHEKEENAFKVGLRLDFET